MQEEDAVKEQEQVRGPRAFRGYDDFTRDVLLAPPKPEAIVSTRKQRSLQGFTSSLRQLKTIIADIFVCVGVTLLLLLRTKMNQGFQKYIIFAVAGIMIFGLTYLLSQQLFQKLIDGVGFNFMS